MGNNGSIELLEKPNGIYEVNVKGNPDYPIVYIRLCWDFFKNKYCIPEVCDVNKTSKQHRKIVVIGIKLPEIENIFEQSFYLSSGLNSIESIEKFLKKELIYDKDKNDSVDIWLPFSGFGYDEKTIITDDDFEKQIKLLKSFFGCIEKSSTCLYGRFGKFNPNLAQISYCLGGKFWDDNFDLFKDELKIEKLPTLNYYIKEKIPCYLVYEGKSNIECSTYLNNYIASAIVYNYSPELLFYKKRILKYFNRLKFMDVEKLKADYRIINILNEKNLFRFKTFKMYADLPFENNYFTIDSFWMNYLSAINKLYEMDPEYFIKNIIPIIEQIIPIPELNLIIENIKTENIKTENIKTENIKTENIKGTKENPHDKLGDAKSGDYYKHGKKVFKKK
jgi:hypothetical protein